jgi:hypothetical protein
MKSLTHYIQGVSNVDKNSIYSKSLSNTGNNFTALLKFTIPKENYTPNKFYCLLESEPLYNNTPRFGFRLSSCSYSPAINGSTTKMTLSTFLYTREGNFSTEPGTFDQIWSQRIIVPSETYYAWLSYQNNTFFFFLNNTLVNTGKLVYPLAPMSNYIAMNTNINGNILEVFLWNTSLNPQEISYLYYTGGLI